MPGPGALSALKRRSHRLMARCPFQTETVPVFYLVGISPRAAADGLVLSVAGILSVLGYATKGSAGLT